jgi:hypothetical protein
MSLKGAASAFDLMSFSGHALQRLIQRAGIRQADDYVPLPRCLATPSLLLAAASGFNGGIPPGRAWPLPVRVNNRRVLLLVKTSSGDPVPAAVTVYRGNWRNFAAVARLEEMLGSVDGNSTDWEGIEPYRDAFVTAAKHFERTGDA